VQSISAKPFCVEIERINDFILRYQSIRVIKIIHVKSFYKWMKFLALTYSSLFEFEITKNDRSTKNVQNQI